MADFEALLRMPLTKGSHPLMDGACVMEKVSIRHAIASGIDPLRSFSALPPCTNDLLAVAANTVNDVLHDSDRQRLHGIVPRLAWACRTEEDARVNTELSLLAAGAAVALLGGRERVAGARLLGLAHDILGGAEPFPVTVEGLEDAVGAAEASRFVLAAVPYEQVAMHSAVWAAGAASIVTYRGKLQPVLDADELQVGDAATRAAASCTHNAVIEAGEAVFGCLGPSALLGFLSSLIDAWEGSARVVARAEAA